jgi:division protein CdvB (Snf7/Vps24/ESCRT-III family)
MTEIRELLQFIKEKNPQESERIFKQIVSERISQKIEEMKKNIFENIVTEETESLSKIAYEIEKDWKNVNYAARPYLDAMKQLNSINDKFGYDDARSIIAYFLSNASSWRGPKAKEIKDKLKKMLSKKPLTESFNDFKNAIKRLEKYKNRLNKDTIITAEKFFDGSVYNTIVTGKPSDFADEIRHLVWVIMNNETDPEILNIAKELKDYAGEDKFYGKPEYPHYDLE